MVLIIGKMLNVISFCYIVVAILFLGIINNNVTSVVCIRRSKNLFTKNWKYKNNLLL